MFHPVGPSEGPSHQYFPQNHQLTLSDGQARQIAILAITQAGLLAEMSARIYLMLIQVHPLDSFGACHQAVCDGRANRVYQDLMEVVSHIPPKEPPSHTVKVLPEGGDKLKDIAGRVLDF